MKLAIHGGPQSVKNALPLAAGHDAEREGNAVKRVLEKGRSPLARGECNLAVRAAAAKLLGVPHCLPVSSGTAAIHTALAALGVGPGDEVITSPCTDYGTIAGILQLNATVVFADLAADSMGIDPEEVRKKITGRTRVILPVHNGGMSVDMAPIMGLARKHGLKVIEDCAQAWGARYRGRFLGAIGAVGVFSMNESKHISSGEGGMLACRAREVYEKCELFSDKCYDRTGMGRSPYMMAVNYRMSEINAAVALEQLRLFPAIAGKRNMIGEELRKGIEQIPGLRAFKVPKNSFASYWFFPFWLDKQLLNVTPAEFAAALRAEGLPAGGSIQPFILHWEVFRKLNRSPSAFAAYRPVGLKRNSYRVEEYPNAGHMEVEAVQVSMNQAWRKRDAKQALAALEKVAGWYLKR